MQLVALRVHAVGPPRARFERASLRLSVDRATLILGDNGSGKTTLLRLARLVFGRTGPGGRIAGLIPEDRVGQVCLEWRDSDSAERMLLGVALKREGERVELARYVVELNADTNADEMINVDDYALGGVRHRFETSGCKVTWVRTLRDWIGLLAGWGLGPDTVLGLSANGESDLMRRLGMRWIKGPQDFLQEFIKHAIRPEERDGAPLTELARRCLDRLRILEAHSRLQVSGLGDRPLVQFSFSEPSARQIKEAVDFASNGTPLERSDRSERLLAEVVMRATMGCLNVKIFDTDRGTYRSLQKFQYSATRVAQESAFTLLQVLMARLWSEGKIRTIFIDAEVTQGEADQELPVLHSWGINVIYLSPFSDIVPLRECEYTYTVASVKDNTGSRTMIGSAIVLEDVADEGDAQGVEEGSRRLGEVFEVFYDETAVSPGDILLTAVRSSGTVSNAALVEDTALRSWITHNRLVLRPRTPMDAGELMYYVRYLGCDRLLGKDIPAGQLVIIRLENLIKVRVPQPDRDTIRAIKDLANAATTFGTWRNEAHRAIDSFFEQSDVAVSKAEIVTAGRLTRQRRESAHVLDELGSRIRSTMPFPIARRWRDVEAAQPDQAGYSQVLSCAETVVTFCASVGLAVTLSQALPVPGISSFAGKVRHGSPLTFGVWSRMLEDLAQYAASSTLPPASMLRQFAGFQGGIATAINRLKGRRNDVAHQRVPGPHEIGVSFTEARAELERLVDSAYWLSDYPLRVVESEIWDSFTDRTVVKYRELVGDHSVVALKSDRPQGRMEIGSPYSADPYGHYWLLRPILHSANCGACGQLTLFVLEKWNSAPGVAEYRALDHGHTCEVAASAGLRAVRLIPSP